MQKEIDMISAQENQCEGPVFQIRNRLEQLTDAMDGSKSLIDEELINKLTYIHMLERMKRDIIATKIKSADMENSLKSKR